MTDAAGTLFFVASDSTTGQELWTSDGTTAGTSLVEDIRSGTASSLINNITAVGNSVFFNADDGSTRREPWTSDGTPAGTFLLNDIVPGSDSSSAQDFTELNGQLYFSATDPSLGREIWTSDGTPVGTTILLDIVSGADSSFPSGLVRYDFRASDDVNGSELWSSDGTAGGTALFQDIHPGVASSKISELTSTGGALAFAANDGVTGEEAWGILTPIVQFTGLTYGIDENGTPIGADIELIRTGNLSAESEVTVHLSGVTATGASGGGSGSDFHSDPITVTFLANDSVASVSIPITQDTDPELTEYLIASLTPVSYAVAGKDDTAIRG